MSDREKLDDFLREKLDGRSFTWKEGYWEAAEKVILADQAARKKRRRFFLFFWLFLAGGAGLTAALYSNLYPLSDIPGTEISLSHNASSSFDSQLLRTQPEIIEELCDESQPLAGRRKYRARATKTVKTHPIFISAQSGVLSGEESASPRASASEESLPGQSFNQNLAYYQMLAFRPHRLTQPTETYSPQFFPGEENPLRKRHYLGISLGTGISPGFQNNRTDKADATFSPVVGLRYAYAVTPAIRLQTGILYQGRGGLHADSTYRSTDFSFGAETMATTISPQTLHYLEIPLVADIRLRGRHSLLAGANLSLLLNARSEVRRQLILPFETQDMETTKEWGYTQGFRPMDMSLTAGYRYYLGRGTRVGFQGNYGLRDITEQGFFRNAVMDRNLQFRFILEYDLAHF